MKLITKTLIATSLTVAMSLAAQQQPTPAQTPSSSDKSTSTSEKSKGGTESQTESTAGGQSSQTITSLQQLSTAASDPTSLQGKRVDLKDAKVQHRGARPQLPPDHRHEGHGSGERQDRYEP